jgi:ketosteroid isomerase-like protein
MSEESTTSDPADATRSVVEAFNRRDFDAVESSYAEDAVLVGDEIGKFDGAAAIRGLYEDMATPYGDLQGEIQEVIDLGSGVTFAIATVVGHPTGSTGQVRFRYAATAVVADGVIVRQTNSMDIDEARAAAERLAEERGS